MPFQSSVPDLSSFVALGDSITAGYADGALYYKGQLHAYPNQLARQCGHNLRQAFVDKHSPGIGFEGRSRLVLVTDTENLQNKWGKLSTAAERGDQHILKAPVYQAGGPFQNMAVPGAKTAHLLMAGYGDPAKGPGNYNPFFSRMASDPARASVLSDALSLDPGFFTLFIGNNDILAYAMYGGTTEGITPLEGAVGEGFEASFRYIVSRLTERGAKGVLATLPDLVTIPFFNTISFDQLLLSASGAASLQALYEGRLAFRAGLNPFPVMGGSADAPQPRLLEAGELVLCELMQDGQAAAYLSGQLPIPKRYYLNREEVAFIRKMTGSYNAVIAQVAAEQSLGLVHLNRLLKRSKPERIYDPKARAIHYLETGAFSLDGIHINALGQALLANEFIKAIYQRYNLKIPRVPIVQFRKKHRSVIHLK